MGLLDYSGGWSATMASLLLVSIGLVLFFVLVLHICLRYGRQDARALWDSSVELARKSPLGRWRY